MLIVTIIREICWGGGGRMTKISNENEAKLTTQKTQILLSLRSICIVFALSNNVMDRTNDAFMTKYFLLKLLKL